MGGLELPVLRREPVDLDDVVLRAASVLRADGGLQVDTAGVAAVQVVGDAGQLGRALAILADNAARHAAGRVPFTLAAHGEVAVVTVADDGDGIPADQQARIFERFTRLDKARQGATGGTGLGLAIARDVVVRHGGSITVDRERRSGARFVITLPVHPQESGARAPT